MLRISEIYLSIQGEGPRVGSPTVFVRFAGCNLKCPGWPCDTPHAIDPRIFTKDQKILHPEQVFDQIVRAKGFFRQYNVCYTGGEPFLQQHGSLCDLTNILQEETEVVALECFSNGTIRYDPMHLTNVSFIMDWKLPGSGEDTINGNRYKNFQDLHYKDRVKFTIKDRLDYDTAKELYESLHKKNPYPSFIYGAVWDAVEYGELIRWVLDDGLPWTFNMQIHNHIWDREKRGI